MEKSVTKQDDILNEYDISLDEYDINAIELSNDPDLKNLDEFMEKIKKGV